MRRAATIALLAAGCASPGAVGEADVGFVERVLAESEHDFSLWLDDPGARRAQVLVSWIETDDAGEPRLVRHGYRVDAEYFYPASSIKTCAAIAGLQWVGTVPGLERDTPLTYHPLFADEVREDRDESNLDGGAITIGHEVRKLAIVSDNRAFNRLYELVGHDELNMSMWAAGLRSVKIQHRLSEARTREENRRAPRITVHAAQGDVTIPERVSALELRNEDLDGLLAGARHVAGGEVVERPFDFTHKNRISLVDLQDMLIGLVRPGLLPDMPEFGLSDEQREFLVQAMTELPRESANPLYDVDEYPDGRMKLFLPGARRVAPDVRITNKIGRAYGFTIENAYLVDPATQRAFFLAAVLYTNPNETVNDGVYGYAELADPYFEALGEVLANELFDPGGPLAD